MKNKFIHFNNDFDVQFQKCFSKNPPHLLCISKIENYISCKYRLYMIIDMSRKKDGVKVWIHINDQHTNFQVGNLWIINENN
jgi:hypothetical protein